MDVNNRIIRAIYNKELFKVSKSILDSKSDKLSFNDSLLLQKAKDVCVNIRNMCLKEGREICKRFEAVGIKASLDYNNNTYMPQYHKFSILIDDEDPTKALTTAIQMGYRSKISASHATWQAFRRSHSQITLTKTDHVSMRMVLKWSQKRELSPLCRRLWPSGEDYKLIPLTAKMWPLAFIVKPLRIILQRTGVTRRDSSIGFFLGTTAELIPELLRFASVGKDDILYDLGSGDGRVVIEAARSFGCQAIGYEQDASLCKIAKERKILKKVDSLVKIKQSDANLAPVEKSTVVFIFQPPGTVLRILPNLLSRLPSGGRIVVHEQLRIKCDPPPNHSEPLIGRSALTVAHLWTVQ